MINTVTNSIASNANNIVVSCASIVPSVATISIASNSNNIVVSSASIIPSVAIPESITVIVSSTPNVPPSIVESNLDASFITSRTRNSSVMKVKVSPKSGVVVQTSKRAEAAEIAVITEEQKTLSLRLNLMESIYNKRMNYMEGEIRILNSKIHVQERVTDALRGEVNRLQQFTRRPCVAIHGIEKRRSESSNELRSAVETVIDSVNSTVSMSDVDKFHRNGRIKDGKQQVIVRFKSHSSKEDFYRARKNQNDCRIYPSLTKTQLSLLHEARDMLKDYKYNESNTVNPPESIFADIHGDIQVKFAKKTNKGMFVKIRSLEHLAFVLETSESCAKDIDYDGEPFDVWGYDDLFGFKPLDELQDCD